ncbi:MAG: metal ABC transporter permease [Pigmentiphaga sp.]|nr:metal ABC transporter permease [Pigmentiphaga sp.]
MTHEEFVQLSLTPLLIGCLASVSCALLGSFLLLRRQSLMGDAISHVVLPGIVGAFLLTGATSALAMMGGALAAALVAVGLIETIRRFGRVEPGAAMGVVFTSLFAVGVLWLERSGASGIHLDVEHVLYGNLESMVWLAADGWPALWDPAALELLPPQLPRLAGVLAIVLVFLALGWRTLVVATFDADFASSIGARPGATGIVLLILVAASTVAAFEAVGAIIVVAMFICPAATARLLTDRLLPQLLWSTLCAVVAAVSGYLLAAHGPFWLGYDASVSAAGMIAVMSGLLLAAACLWGPHRGAAQG